MSSLCLAALTSEYTLSVQCHGAALDWSAHSPDPVSSFFSIGLCILLEINEDSANFTLIPCRKIEASSHCCYYTKLPFMYILHTLLCVLSTMFQTQTGNIELSDVCAKHRWRKVKNV